MRSEVFGGNKLLHEESESFITNRMEKYLPKTVMYSGSFIAEIASDAEEIRQHGLYALLGYESFDDYCTDKLKTTADWVNNIIEFFNRTKENITIEQANDRIAKLAKDVPTLNAHGAIGNGRADKNENVSSTDEPVKFGNCSKYRIAKLKRDHPEIAERMIAGEFKTVSEAEREAGIRPPKKTHVDNLFAAFMRLSGEEQAEFLSMLRRT